MKTRSSFIAVLAATTLAQVASTMGIAVFPVIAPRLASEMALAPATIGYLVSLTYGTAAIASTLMSFAVPRWGACRAIQIGLTLCALSMALALTASVPGLAMTAILLGLGMTLMTPASGHLLFRFSPAQNRNLIFSIKQTGVPGGWMLMALTAPAITLAFGWRWAIGVVFVISVATALGLQRVRAHWDDDRTPGAARWVNPATGLKLLWRYPTLRWLAVSSLFLIVFGLAAVGWNGLFLAEIAHGSPHGMVSVATSAALAWNFGGILIGPALFAATYAWSGSYAQTFGGLSAIAFLGVVALTLSRAARRRERLCSKN